MANSVITGIDISHHSVKAVVLRARSKQIELIHYQELPTMEGIFSDNHTFNHHQCVKILKALKKLLPRRANRVVVSVPNNTVISKKIQIDVQLHSEETEFAISQAFASQSPFPLENLYLDYVELTALQGKSHVADYQVYAIRKEAVDSRVALLKEAGFTPLVIDTVAHNLLRTWQLASLHCPNHRNWLLIDIGSSQSLFGMMSNNKPTQSLSSSGKDAQQLLFNYDWAGVTTYFKELNFGTDQLPPILSTLDHNTVVQFNEQLVDFAQSLARQISLFDSVNQSQSIEGLWLTGSGADLFQQLNLLDQQDALYLDAWLSDYLGLPIAFFDPLSVMIESKPKSSSLSFHWLIKLFQTHHAQTDNNLSECRFSLATGLAIRGLQWQQTHSTK